MINAAFILREDYFEDVYGAECVAEVSRHARVLGPTPLSAEQLASNPPDWLADVEVLFTGWGAPLLDAALLARLPRLRVVFYAAGTLRFLVTDACWERGLVIVNAAAQNAVPTAEFATGAILLALKRAWHQAGAVRALRAFPARPLPVPGGCGSTIGLVSLGLVGRRVAEKLADLDVTILAHDPYAPPGLMQQLHVEPASLTELFAQSDVISVHTPLVPETAGFIEASLLNRLKPGATFINTARGALVNETDLAAVLRARPDVQAVLDVTDPEPPLPDSPLYELPNIFLTPHIAGSLGRECRRMGRAMVEEFERYLLQAPLHHMVTREELRRRA